MSERYTRLFSLPKNLYAPNAPVLIAAGALLKDNVTGTIVAQLKIESIDNKIIKAAKVQIQPLDTIGKSLGEPIEYQFLDLNVTRDANFGSKTAIQLPDITTRGFNVSVLSVAYMDNTVWETKGDTWEPLPEQAALNTYLSDNELVKQYKLKFNEKAQYQPDKIKGVWRCACGAVNTETEKRCHSCGLDCNELFTLDISALVADKDARVEKERIAVAEKAERERTAAAEKAEMDRRAAEKRAEEEKAAAEARKKRKKIIGIFSGVAVLVIAAVLVVTQVVIPANKYKKAEDLLTAGEYDGAMEVFTELGTYSDAAERITEAQHLKELAQQEAENVRQYTAAEALLAAGDYEAAVAAFSALSDYKDASERADEALDLAMSSKYSQAEALLESGDYDGAITAFSELGDYRDASERIMSCEYSKAEVLLESGDTVKAAIAFYVLGDYSDAKERSTSLWDSIAVHDTIAAGSMHTVGLKIDGTVIGAGNNRDVSDWTDIVAITTNIFHTVGLKADGTVVAVGRNEYGQCGVSGWRDIVAIGAGTYHTVGLKSNGKVVAIGLNEYGRCDVSSWTNIVAITTGGYHTVGLKSDGTVVAVGDFGSGQCDVSDWTDIVAVTAGSSHTVGLKSDGTVVAVGDNFRGQCDVSDWKDIVVIAADTFHTVGLKSDGTVVATGLNEYGQCDVSSWTDIKVP